MKKIQIALIAVTGIAYIAAITPWIITFGGNPLSPSLQDWGNFGDYIGGILSGPLAVVGFIALLITIQQQRDFAQAEQNKANDLKFFESAQQCLLRAYETIKPNNAETPPKSRMVWLTTARWLLAATALGNRISDTSPALRRV